MAINNFKPFATAANANVTAQADWETLPALLSGFMAGKASSAQVNKAIRQASFIAAALAQYTANKSGLDVLDDGDLNGFISKMGTALGKDFQALDATLTALAGLETGANKLPYFTGNDTAAQTDLTSVGRDIIGKNTIADILTYLGLGDGTGRLLGVQAFSISGTYVKSAGVKKIIVEAVGGGGASGNLSATASNNAGISSVGSPGCYAKSYYYENIPATVAVTIGSGGVAGTGSGGSGGDGGQTSFGTLMVCPGGKGSQQIQKVPPFSGGSTGEAGQPTGTGILFHSVSRSPSCAVMGLTEDQSIGLENTISTLLGVYGKGGTGVYNPANSPARNGNNGSQGYMLIWEYQ